MKYNSFDNRIEFHKNLLREMLAYHKANILKIDAYPEVPENCIFTNKTKNKMETERLDKIVKSAKTIKEIAVNFVKDDFDIEIKENELKLQGKKADLEFFKSLNTVTGTEYMLSQLKLEEKKVRKENQAILDEVLRLETLLAKLNVEKIPTFEKEARKKLCRIECYLLAKINELEESGKLVNKEYFSDVFIYLAENIESIQEEINDLELEIMRGKDFKECNDHLVDVIKKGL